VWVPARIPWIDRRFDFNFPIGVYPELIERLRGTPARAADRIRALPSERLSRRVGSAWSIQDHVGHLADLDQILFMARLDDYDAGASVLRAADMANSLTDAAHHDRKAVGDVLARFHTLRAGLVARLEGLDAAALARSALHPRLNCPMRVVDMMYFHAEHDDYHLARISELLRMPSQGRNVAG
jgi:uncharacterized damage-inducible protein DinB